MDDLLEIKTKRERTWFVRFPLDRGKKNLKT